MLRWMRLGGHSGKVGVTASTFPGPQINANSGTPVASIMCSRGGGGQNCSFPVRELGENHDHGGCGAVWPAKKSAQKTLCLTQAASVAS